MIADPIRARPARPLLHLFLLSVLLPGVGCTQQLRPDYARPLPPGHVALRPVPGGLSRVDLLNAYRDADDRVLRAIDASLAWFEAPSSRRFFPFEEIGLTHERARVSLVAFRDLLETAPTAADFVEAVRTHFDVYESVGYDGTGVVLFTGYYAPVFPASRTRTERFRYPLYRRPADLVTDPVTGAPQGRRTPTGGIEPYPTRREIESTGMLAGTELVWLEDRLSAYLVHVNGSAKLTLPDGLAMYVGYAGKTDRPYASLGQAMVEDGLLARDDVSLASIRRVYARKPARVEALMDRNESFVFFTESDGTRWPVGSLGVPVTAETTLATDKRIFPRGGLVFVRTNVVTAGSSLRPFNRFMLDQDTGGAINAPGRADIFMGVGRGAEILAGGQAEEGRLYYIFLKPGRIGGRPSS